MIMFIFTFNSMNFDKNLMRFDNELVINLVLSINCNMQDIFFIISSPFLSILITSSSIGIVKVNVFLNVFFRVFS